MVDTSSGTTYQETATYTCANSYQLVGATTRTCQDNGEWSSTAPICEGKTNKIVHWYCLHCIRIPQNIIITYSAVLNHWRLFH